MKLLLFYKPNKITTVVKFSGFKCQSLINCVRMISGCFKTVITLNYFFSVWSLGPLLKTVESKLQKWMDCWFQKHPNKFRHRTVYEISRNKKMYVSNCLSIAENTINFRDERRKSRDPCLKNFSRREGALGDRLLKMCATQREMRLPRSADSTHTCTCGNTWTEYYKHGIGYRGRTLCRQRHGFETAC